MGTAFTPGPWSTGPSNIVRRQFRNEHNQRVTHWIAECCSQVGRIREENEANARLIAAAPELYEALEYALRIFTPAYHTSPLENGARKRMLSALAKARGEQ